MFLSVSRSHYVCVRMHVGMHARVYKCVYSQDPKANNLYTDIQTIPFFFAQLFNYHWKAAQTTLFFFTIFVQMQRKWHKIA